MNDDALRQLFIVVLCALIVTAYVAVNYGVLVAIVTHVGTGFWSFGGLYIYERIKKMLEAG